MGRKSKYEGGSELVSFRLPALKLKEAKAQIELLLMGYEKESKFTVSIIGNGFEQNIINVTGVQYGDPIAKDHLFKENALRDIMAERESKPEPYLIPTDEEWAELAAKAKPLVDEMKELDPEFFAKLSRIYSDSKPEERIPGTLEKKSIPTEYIIEKLPPGNLDKFLSNPNPPTSSGWLYPCGCMEIGDVFQRAAGCEMIRPLHHLNHKPTII